VRRESSIEDAVRQLGGIVQAAAKGGTTPQSVYKAQKDGFVRQARVALLWAELLEPTDLKARWQLVRRLAGLG
jgi:hypothetical protein